MDIRQATENEFRCLSEFNNIIHHEYLPDDPPIPLEEYIQGWKTVPDFVEYEAYAAWDLSNTKIIAFCRIMVFNTGDNEHLARFGIEILPEYRRQGIGRQALALLLPFAQKRKRTLWMTFAWDNIVAATQFLEELGARRGSEIKMNQLKLAEFDHSVVERWLEQSEKLKMEFELGFWDAAYPDANLDDVVALLQEVANDQPRDSLEMEDMKFTPQLLRSWEKNTFARGDQRWTMYAMDKTNGKVVGLTDVFWNPNRRMILNQAFTGVYPAYRSKGLGRWLKAEMMQKVLRERPEVQFIRTGNATSNVPMLKINNEMGFKPYIANTIWQVETEKIEKYVLEKENKVQ
jgi:GNAT superfamily N-acetyltransferase